MTDNFDEDWEEYQRSNTSFFAGKGSLFLMIAGGLTTVAGAVRVYGESLGSKSNSGIDGLSTVVLGLTLLGLGFLARKKPIPALLAAILIIVSDRVITAVFYPEILLRGSLWLLLVLAMACKALHSSFLANGRTLPGFGGALTVAGGIGGAYWVLMFILAFKSSSPGIEGLSAKNLTEDETALAYCLTDSDGADKTDCRLIGMLYNEDEDDRRNVYNKELAAKFKHFKSCHNQQMRDILILAVVRFKVEKSGKVADPEVIATNPHTPTVRKCVQSTLAKLKFKPKKGALKNAIYSKVILTK